MLKANADFEILVSDLKYLIDALIQQYAALRRENEKLRDELTLSTENLLIAQTKLKENKRLLEVVNTLFKYYIKAITLKSKKKKLKRLSLSSKIHYNGILIYEHRNFHRFLQKSSQRF